MRLRLLVLASLLAAAALPAATSTAASPAARGGDHIVVLRPGANVDSAVAGVRAGGGSVRHVYRHTLQGFSATLPARAVDALRRNPQVAFVEPDGVVTIDAPASLRPAEATSEATLLEQSGATWGLDRIDQRGLPLDGIYRYGPTGKDVRTYVVDTGVRSTHVEFTGRMAPGYTAFADGVGTEDCHGHGTHVAGTIAGTTWGVAKAATVVPVRVLDCNGSGSWSGIVAGLDWIGATHPAGTGGVANMSLGGGASSSVDLAVANLSAAGVTVVAAAGNNNDDACSYSPARAPAAVTVGATTSSDARASYSNTGTCLDLFAPGSSIRSASSGSDTGNRTMSGTSMAAPHVAGAAALLLETSPTASPAQISSTIVGAATTGLVTGAGTGSPNLLLFTDPAPIADEPTEPTEPSDPVPPTEPAAPVVVDVDSVTVRLDGGRWLRGTATVTTVTSDGAAAAAVTVTGRWFVNGSPGATASGATGSTGTVSFDSGNTRTTGSDLDFCVTSLGGEGYESVTFSPARCAQQSPPPSDDPIDQPIDDPVDDPIEQPADPFSLSATGSKVRAHNVVDLRWTAQDSGVTIQRNGTTIATLAANASSYRDETGQKGGATYRYRVCAGSSCSAEVTVTF